MSKILLIDDDAQMSELYKVGLNSAGHEVELVEDGQQGLEKALVMKPDIILLDIMMPTMNGFDVLKQLRAAPEVEKTPVIILTNLAESSEEQTATAMGAKRYIVKNQTEPKELAKIIDEVLKPKK